MPTGPNGDLAARAAYPAVYPWEAGSPGRRRGGAHRPTTSRARHRSGRGTSQASRSRAQGPQLIGGQASRVTCAIEDSPTRNGRGGLDRRSRRAGLDKPDSAGGPCDGRAAS